MHFGVPANTEHISSHTVGVWYVLVECMHDCMCERKEERLLTWLTRDCTYNFIPSPALSYPSPALVYKEPDLA